MSSNTFSPSQFVRPEPSKLLATVLLLAHLLTWAVMFFLPVSVWVLLVLSVLIVLSFIHVMRVHVLNRGQRAIRKLRRNSDGSWNIRDTHGVYWLAHLQEGTFAHPRLVILNLELSDGTKRSVVLLRDSVTKDTLRRLNVYLRVFLDQEDTKHTLGQ